MCTRSMQPAACSPAPKRQPTHTPVHVPTSTHTSTKPVCTPQPKPACKLAHPTAHTYAATHKRAGRLLTLAPPLSSAAPLPSTAGRVQRSPRISRDATSPRICSVAAPTSSSTSLPATMAPADGGRAGTQPEAGSAFVEAVPATAQTCQLHPPLPPCPSANRIIHTQAGPLTHALAAL